MSHEKRNCQEISLPSGSNTESAIALYQNKIDHDPEVSVAYDEIPLCGDDIAKTLKNSDGIKTNLTSSLIEDTTTKLGCERISNDTLVNKTPAVSMKYGTVYIEDTSVSQIRIPVVF